MTSYNNTTSTNTTPKSSPKSINLTNIRGYLPISFIISLMVMLFLIISFTLLPPMFGAGEKLKTLYYPSADIVGYFVTVYLFIFVIICFIRAAATDPGRVPTIWPWNPNAQDPRFIYNDHHHQQQHEHEAEVAAGGGISRKQQPKTHPNFLSTQNTNDDNDDDENQQILLNRRGIERKADGKARFCRACGHYKPDRSHHCRVMQRCVLEMDHFCPWIRNTVGYYNKKYFLQLIFYGAITLISFCITLVPHFVAAFNMKTALDFFIIFGWLVGCLFGLVLVGFFTFHFWLVSRSYTTIEFCEKRNAKATKRTIHGAVCDIYHKSPYDHGIMNNLKHVLGSNVFLWLIPTRYGMPSNVYAGAVFRIDKSHPLYKIVEKGDGGGDGDSTDDDQSALLGQ